ncbi:MAG: ABC transporter ATP-binding protein [Chloroflexota bacterium]
MTAGSGAASGAGPAVETRGLHKRYGRTVALESLDLRVERGEVFGLLGPNGAGKTTTVKLLLGLTNPTSGEGRLLGRPMGDREARRRTGYLPELFRYPHWLRAREVLRLHCELAELPRRTWDHEVDTALERVGLATRGADKVSGFSKGMQQRLGLGVALLGDPEIVILDEPTSALDPLGRDEVRSIIRDAGARGTTVILNSHLLGEVERLCDRVTIIHRGRAIAAGTVRELLGEPALRIRVSGLADPAALLGGFGPVVGLDEDGSVRLRPLAAEQVPEAVAAVVAAGGRVHAVEPGRGSLEDAFLQLVRGDGTAATAVAPAAAATPRPPEDGA